MLYVYIFRYLNVYIKDGKYVIYGDFLVLFCISLLFDYFREILFTYDLYNL